jgi:large subunit ribosomal protein L9
MEVILKQDVDKLGKVGSILKVKDGFARNFLIPNKLAVPLTPENLKKLQEEKKRKIMELEKAKNECLKEAQRLEGLSITLPALVHEEEKLYGSITAQDIALALKEEGFVIDKNSILLEEPIKSLGIYEVSIRLHPEVLTKIKVWIVKK